LTFETAERVGSNTETKAASRAEYRGATAGDLPAPGNDKLGQAFVWARALDDAQKAGSR